MLQQPFVQHDWLTQESKSVSLLFQNKDNMKTEQPKTTGNPSPKACHLQLYRFSPSTELEVQAAVRHQPSAFKLEGKKTPAAAQSYTRSIMEEQPVQNVISTLSAASFTPLSITFTCNVFC